MCIKIHNLKIWLLQFILMSTQAFSQNLEVTLKAGDFSIDEIGGEGQRIIMNSFGNAGEEPGKPDLPGKIFLIALPPGANILSVDFNFHEELIPGKFNIMPAAPVYCFGDWRDRKKFEETAYKIWQQNKEKIYQSDQYYPNKYAQIVTKGKFRNIPYVAILYNPFKWCPRTGEVLISKFVNVSINYEIADQNDKNIAIPDRFKEIASSLFINFSEIEEEYKFSSNKTNVYDYIIIIPQKTSSALNTIQPLINWKEGIGYSVKVVDLNETGHSLQNIRTFLKNTYLDWQTQYVLLIGDYLSIPMLNAFPKYPIVDDTDWPIPTDSYLAELTYDDESSWDADGDNHYGELTDDDIDLSGLVDVFVGRIPFNPESNAAIVSSICQKIVSFESDKGDWKNNAMLIGALAYNSATNNLQWDSTDQMETIKSNIHSLSYTTLYEKADDEISTPDSDYELSHYNVKNLWKSNQFSMIFWASHGGSLAYGSGYNGAYRNYKKSGQLYSMPFIAGTDAEELSGASPIVFAGSCVLGHPRQSLTLDLFSHDATVATISATRLSYSHMPWMTFDFMSALKPGESVERNLGDAFYISKVNYWLNNGGNSNLYEYANTLTFCLFGDPSLSRKGINIDKLESRIRIAATPPIINSAQNAISAISARIENSNGDLISTATNEISFSIISGASSGQLIGQNPVSAVNGQASISLQATTVPGIVAIEASSPGLVTGRASVVVYNGNSPTEIGGNITENTTLSLANSPYAVTRDLNVREGVTLTIEPGVVVMFNQDRDMDIYGALVANGTPTLPIIFTANTATPYPAFWDQIEFHESFISQSSILNHCIISYGDKTIVLNAKANPTISNITMQYNTYTGIYLISGIYSSDITLKKLALPYIIYGDMTLDVGATLTIEPGAILKFTSESDLVIKGGIVAEGTSSEKIIFTSIKDDAHGGDTDNNGETFGSTNDWGGFYIDYTINDLKTRLINCEILYAGYSGFWDSRPDAFLIHPEANPTIENVTFTKCKGNGIELLSGRYSSNILLNIVGVPYYVGDLTIDPGGELYINPGVIIKFKIARGLKIKGRVNVIGTTSEKIIFTSLRDDAHGGDTDNNGSTSGTAGYWDGIEFYETIEDGNCILSNCEIMFAGGDNNSPIELHPYVNPQITNIILENNMRNGIELWGGNYDSDISLNITEIPYILRDDLNVNESAILRIFSGVLLKFGERTDIRIKGGLLAQGTDSNHIIFTSLQDDQHGGDSNGDGASVGSAGDWGGISFDYSTIDTNTVLNYCDILYAGQGGYGNYDSPIELHPMANPTITNVSLQNNRKNGIDLWTGAYSSDINLDITSLPYMIRGDLTMNEGATLTINPGVLLKFDNGGDFYIKGGLMAQGTSNNHVILTSLRDDSHGGDTDGEGTTNGSSGDWGGVWFDDTVIDSNCNMNYCDIMYAGAGGYGNLDSPIELDARANPTLTNIYLSNNNRNGIDVATGNYSSDIILDIIQIPYMIRRDIKLESSAKLTVAPGVIIKFDAGSDLYIRGALRAGGTADSHIIFTSLRDDWHGGDTNGDGASAGSKGDWGGICFYDSVIDTSSVLTYCEIMYAGSGGYGNNDSPFVLDGKANPQITNCTLENNTWNAINLVAGTYSSDFYLDILNFPYIVRGDIIIASPATFTINPGIIIKFDSGTDFYIDGAFVAAGTNQNPITFTSIKDDSSGGDSNGDGSSVGSPGDWGGIRFRDASDDLNCVLENVKILFGGSGGYGNNRYPLEFDNSSPKIQQVIIAKSLSHGVTCYHAASPDFGGGDKGSLGQNKFLDFVSTENKYAIYNESTSDIFARHNFWETNDADEIARNIYDKNDNSDKGEVFFTPFNLTDDATAPSVTILSPNGNEQYIIGSSQNIVWSASDNVGILKLYFYLSRNEGNSFLLMDSLLSNPGILTWNVEGPASDLCKLKILALDYSGNAGYDISDSYFAIVDTANTVNYPPTTPAILYPIYYAEVQPNDYLIWTKSTDLNSGDEIRYTLQIASDSSFSNIIIEQSDINGENGLSGLSKNKVSLIVGKNGSNAVYLRINTLNNYSVLIDDSTYYWRIKAVDNHGAESDFTDGTTHFFFNKINTAPRPVADGFSPSDGLEVRTNKPEISWFPATDPDLSDNASNLKYILQLDDDGEFLNDYQYQYTTSLGFNTIKIADQLAENHNWFYRVQTIDDEGLTSEWSSAHDFWVNAIDEPPLSFALISPVDNSLVEVDTIEFIWENTNDNDPNDEFIFVLEFSQDSTFSSGVITMNCQSDTFCKVEANNLDAPAYFWRVKAKDNDNLVSWGSESNLLPMKFFIRATNVPVRDYVQIVTSFKVFQNYPNPFNSSTTIKYQLPVAGQVSVSIVNMNGQLIKTLVDEEKSSGYYTVSWDGKTHEGNQLSSGVYFIRFMVKNRNGIKYNETKKIMYIK